jgi:transcriptional regulator GlxA family with amidase domain
MQLESRPSAVNARNVAIIVFDGVEVLDFAGPFEVFSVAAGEMPGAPYAPFFTYTVGLNANTVVASGGLRVEPHFSLADAPAPDILIVPGGNGSRRLLKNDVFLDWLGRQASQAEIVSSVCTGALALARAGLLAEKRATTHHGAFDRLAELEPTAHVVRNERFVRDGNTWTSGGISAGIDMSLAIVKALLHDNTAVVDEMEWMWHQALAAR